MPGALLDTGVELRTEFLPWSEVMTPSSRRACPPLRGGRGAEKPTRRAISAHPQTSPHLRGGLTAPTALHLQPDARCSRPPPPPPPARPALDSLPTPPPLSSVQAKGLEPPGHPSVSPPLSQAASPLSGLNASSATAHQCCQHHPWVTAAAQSPAPFCILCLGAQVPFWVRSDYPGSLTPSLAPHCPQGRERPGC